MYFGRNICYVIRHFLCQKEKTESNIERGLLYGSEYGKNLEATEMWYLSQMMRKPWTAKLPINDFMEMDNESRALHASE